jgi:hypothetical protein
LTPRPAYAPGVTQPYDQSKPEHAFDEDAGHGGDPELVAAHAPEVPTSSARRIGRALVRTLIAFRLSWSGQVHGDGVPERPIGFEPTAGSHVPAAPSARDKWIGAVIMAAVILGCLGLLRWLAG